MKKRNYVKILSTFLATIMMLASFCITSFAVDPGYIEVNSWDSGFLCFGSSYKLYRDYTFARAFYPGLSVCAPMYHISGRSEVQLTYSKEVTLSAQTAREFSTSLGLEVSVEVIKMIVEKALTLSIAAELSVSNTGGAAMTLPRSAPTGYYSMVPAINFRRYELDKMKKGSTQVQTSYYAYGIIKDTYWVVIYDTSDTNNHSYHIYG